MVATSLQQPFSLFPGWPLWRGLTVHLYINWQARILHSLHKQTSWAFHCAFILNCNEHSLDVLLQPLVNKKIYSIHSIMLVTYVDYLLFSYLMLTWLCQSLTIFICYPFLLNVFILSLLR